MAPSAGIVDVMVFFGVRRLVVTWSPDLLLLPVCLSNSDIWAASCLFCSSTETSLRPVAGCRESFRWPQQMVEDPAVSVHRLAEVLLPGVALAGGAGHVVRQTVVRHKVAMLVGRGRSPPLEVLGGQATPGHDLAGKAVGVLYRGGRVVLESRLQRQPPVRELVALDGTDRREGERLRPPDSGNAAVVCCAGHVHVQVCGRPGAASLAGGPPDPSDDEHAGALPRPPGSSLSSPSWRLPPGSGDTVSVRCYRRNHRSVGLRLQIAWKQRR